MRFLAVAALAAALAACGGGDDGDQFAAGNSELSQAQIEAALGPADQSGVEDALPADSALNGLGNMGNDAAAADNSAAAGNEVER